MPDGQGLCFAVRLPDGNAAKNSLSDQPESSQHATSIAEPFAPTGSPHHQQAIPLTDSSIQQQPVSAITGNAQQQSIHSANGRDQRPAETEANDSSLQYPPPGDVEIGSVARPANADLQR